MDKLNYQNKYYVIKTLLAIGSQGVRMNVPTQKLIFPTPDNGHRNEACDNHPDLLVVQSGEEFFVLAGKLGVIPNTDRPFNEQKVRLLSKVVLKKALFVQPVVVSQQSHQQRWNAENARRSEYSHDTSYRGYSDDY
jgi:hypothetical protein